MKPCPFCGSEIKASETDIRLDMAKHPKGTKCMLDGESFSLKLWNTRAYPRLKKAIEEMEQEFDEKGDDIMLNIWEQIIKPYFIKHIPESKE